MKKTLFTLLSVFIACQPILSQTPVGSIKGKVVDISTLEPLTGVAVTITRLNIGKATDTNGEFEIKNVPVGSYSLSYQQIGYQKTIKPDIIIRSGRITFVNAELQQATVPGDDIVVTTSYYIKDDIDPTSVVDFSGEEVRRMPGSAGDVSRILMSLPSTAMVSDNANDLAVRGGSPTENGFFVDNIQINNINHFPVQGSSGGPIGLLNVDLIEDATFYAGGFSAAYGNRLSSVVDIKLREGNPDEYDAQLDLSMGGAGCVVEGPLHESKGSFIVSARESYLDLFADAIGSGSVPRYGDAHVKATYHINPSNIITLIDIFGHSHIKYSREDAIDIGTSAYGDYLAYMNTSGINWRSLWSRNGYSNTSVSCSFVKTDMTWYKVDDHSLNFDNDYIEGQVRLRNVNHYRINNSNSVQLGLTGEYELADYDWFVAEEYNRLGETVPEIDINDRFNSWKSGGFANYSFKPVKRLTTTLGCRADYFSYNENIHFSPRFTTSLNLTNRLTLNGSTGIFYQNLPMTILSLDDSYKKLKDLKATHYVVGFDYMLTEDTKFTVEAYDKEYEHFPLDTGDPAKFIIDDAISIGGQASQYIELVDLGEAYTRGIEVLIQKKLARKLYGLVSGSFFRSRYKDLNGVWRDRAYDNKYIFSVISGYKLNDKYEFSFKWIYAGGVPYTPLDENLSAQYGTGIVDISRLNGERYPAYHSLNIRYDERYNFKNSAIVAYLSLWNVYNRKNVAAYTWDEYDNEIETEYQWSFIPIGGIEYEF